MSNLGGEAFKIAKGHGVVAMPGWIILDLVKVDNHQAHTIIKLAVDTVHRGG